MAVSVAKETFGNESSAHGMSILGRVNIIDAFDHGIGGIGDSDSVQVGAVPEQKAKKRKDRRAGGGIDHVNGIG